MKIGIKKIEKKTKIVVKNSTEEIDRYIDRK